MAIHWNFDSKYTFTNKNFAKIYSFFVIESPVEGTSKRGITFKQRNTDLNSLSACMKRDVPPLKVSWLSAPSKDVESKVKEYGIYESVKLPCEIAIHSEKNNSKVIGLYYAVRCALAHGAFSIHQYKDAMYYFLENKDNGILKGRIVLKEESLLALINAIETASTKKPRKKAKKREKELVTV